MGLERLLERRQIGREPRARVDGHVEFGDARVAGHVERERRCGR